MAKALGLAPSIDPTASVRDCQLGAYTEVGARTRLLECRFGDYSYIVQDGEANATTVGKFCSIASHVRLNPGNHPMERAAQAHFTYRASAYWPEEPDEAALFEWRRSTPVVLGHDVWLGHGVVVLPGRSIGTGAVVGANAVVTRDIPPYAIAVGNPARVVRPRFPPAIAERLLALAWWDWSHAALRLALPDFRGLAIEAFLEKYGG
jgi:phosphonate metabolism protein (transferase hexapeptide repeat family)